MHRFVLLLGLALPSLAAPQEAARDEVWNLERLREEAGRIQDEIEVLRGLAFEGPVRIELADREAFLAYARETLEADGGRARLEREEEVAKLLGLVPGDFDLLAETTEVLVEQVGGFYDARRDTFYVMESVQPDLARVVIAHEFTHALDDQHFDLDGTASQLAGNADAALAHHAVVEGSGMELMFEWARRHMDLSALGRVARAQADLPSDAVASAPPLVWKPLVGLYLQGQAFLRRERRPSPLGQPARVGDLDRAFQEPPRSTEQVIHPAKYWNPEHRDEPRVVRAQLGPLPDGAVLRHENTLGELLVALVTEPFEERGGLDVSGGLLGLAFTNEAATGWGGDRYVLLAHGEGRVLRWLTRWDSAQDADEFAAALSDLSTGIEAAKASAPGHAAATSGLRIERVDGDAVLVTSWSGLAEAQALALAAAVRFEEPELDR